MPDISKIVLPGSATVYDIKDANARDRISALESYTDYLGVTTTALTDGSTTNPVTINGSPVTAVNGNIVNYGSKEFIFNGTVWQEFGDLSGLGSLAYKNSADGSYTPAGSISLSNTNKTAAVSAASSGTVTYTPGGTVSQPTFTGSATTSTGSFTPAGSVSLTNTNKTATVAPAASGTATYTPAGSVAAPTISVKTAGSTTTVNSITAVGTLPTFTGTTYSVASETLTIGAEVFNAGTLPTKGANTTVKTGDAAYQATAPTFTGTGVRLVTDNIAVPSSASFSGTAGSVSVSGTPSGTVSQPTFSGTGVRLVTGNIAVPNSATFSGTAATITVD